MIAQTHAARTHRHPQNRSARSRLAVLFRLSGCYTQADGHAHGSRWREQDRKLSRESFLPTELPTRHCPSEPTGHGHASPGPTVTAGLPFPLSALEDRA